MGIHFSSQRSSSTSEQSLNGERGNLARVVGSQRTSAAEHPGLSECRLAREVSPRGSAWIAAIHASAE